METMELLAWARGPGLTISLSLMLLGIIVRLFEMLALGRKADLAEPRDPASAKYGFRTIFTRSLPQMPQLRSSPIALIAGYVFHIGLFLVVFFYVPHILVIEDLLGISWGGLPFWLIDAVTLVTMAAMLIVLWYRWSNPVRRFLSRFGDYFAWLVTFLPLITGYLAYHRLFLPYNDMLAIHILSVELLFVSIPFTKLMHAVTFAFSRYYNGEVAGRKGVKV